MFCCLLQGCSFWYDLLDRSREVIVTQLALLPDCDRSEEPEPQLHLFDGAATVASWQQQHGLPATQIDPSIEGPFVLVEVGQRAREGESLLVSRDAMLHSGGRLVLQGTFFRAATASPDEASACVLLALPPRSYDAIELYDQEGALRARTTQTEEYNP